MPWIKVIPARGGRPEHGATENDRHCYIALIDLRRGQRNPEQPDWYCSSWRGKPRNDLSK